jgi:DNA polymerase III epsilon subunit-like protein
VAKEKLPDLKNCKLKTLVKHFGLPAFKHHDASEDSMACARIFLKLMGNEEQEPPISISDEAAEFKGIIMGILADDEVNYKEACELLYWLEDHPEIAAKHQDTYLKTKDVLEDDHLDNIEAVEMSHILNRLLKNL